MIKHQQLSGEIGKFQQCYSESSAHGFDSASERFSKISSPLGRKWSPSFQVQCQNWDILLFSINFLIILHKVDKNCQEREFCRSFKKIKSRQSQPQIMFFSFYRRIGNWSVMSRWWQFFQFLCFWWNSSWSFRVLRMVNYSSFLYL